MAREGEYTVNSLYQGGHSSLSPSYGDIFTGYQVDAGSLGITTDPRSANILKEVSSKLAGGGKQVELALVSPEVFDSIPKQQLKEVHRLGKLTGVDMSVHAPVMDSAGMSQQGFSEVNREAAERRMIEVVERSNEVNPTGNMPVTFHSAEGIPGTEFETFDGERKARRMIAVNRESGKMIPLETEKKYYPNMERVKPEYEEGIKKGKISTQELSENREKYIENIPLKKGKVYSAKENLKVANATEWDNSISQVFFNKERADEILQQNHVQIAHLIKGIQDGTIRQEEINKIPEYRQAMSHHQAAENYLQEVHTTANALFSRAYKYGNEGDRKILEGISEIYKKELNEKKDAMGESIAMQNLLNSLKSEVSPQMNIPIEEFAAEKSSISFGNTAFESYKKFGTKAPIISIENPPAGFALSTGEDLRNLIVKSREQFVERAIESGKLSESEAKVQAEKLIGATWDVGHINMIRKQGATEKDVIRETEKIAPFVKHIHLSDNFGFEHTELPMGMGNVPLKEMMEKLPQKDIKKIVEAGQWWQHFQTNPIRESFEGLGSPMYTSGTGPLWNQTPAFQEGYFSGYGMMLPSINYETFGAGFSRLPAELGGSRQGGGGRMGGTPME
ncbi:sugar phosphate isomerase/epimerase [Candidatus Pacearchaeota archaeon]|nr:sugar phosphate isomerase/epimerase [Candidatus Pacearchaeota archaeon]